MSEPNSCKHCGLPKEKDDGQGCTRPSTIIKGGTIKGYHEFNESEWDDEFKPRDNWLYCANTLSYNPRMSEEEESDIYECSKCGQTIYWSRD